MQECAAIYCILLAMLEYWVGVNLVVKFSNVYNFLLRPIFDRFILNS